MAELQGCWQEALRAEDIANALSLLAEDLPLDRLDIDRLIVYLRETCHLLEDLARRFDYESDDDIHNILPNLRLVLPSLQRTLVRMRSFLNDGELSMRRKWSVMDDELFHEAMMSLENRFELYNTFIYQVHLLLTGSNAFDRHGALARSRQIWELRALQGIARLDLRPGEEILALPRPRPRLREVRRVIEYDEYEPPRRPEQPRQLIGRAPILQPAVDIYPLRMQWGPRPPPPPPVADYMNTVQFTQTNLQVNTHWGERIFDNRHTYTQLRNRRPSIDNKALSLSVFLSPLDSLSSRIRIRSYASDGSPRQSCLGIHRLCIERVGSSLQLTRYCHTRQRQEEWARLYFDYWEHMVLFHCTFMALKSVCPQTDHISPQDYVLDHERELFSHKISENNIISSLTIYHDREHRSLRLQASHHFGTAKGCPIWTAFGTARSLTISSYDLTLTDENITVTRKARSSRWVSRVTDFPDRCFLSDLSQYAFCDTYRPARNSGVELRFSKASVVDEFIGVFEKLRDDGGA